MYNVFCQIIHQWATQLLNYTQPERLRHQTDACSIRDMFTILVDIFLSKFSACIRRKHDLTDTGEKAENIDQM